MYQTFRSFRFFYSCIASVIGLNIALFLSVVHINWNTYPNGLPDYANAIENLTFRLPVWLLATFIIAALSIAISEWERPFEAKVRLLAINTLNWIIFQILVMGAYWFFLPYRIIEVLLSFPAISLLRFFKLG